MQTAARGARDWPHLPAPTRHSTFVVKYLESEEKKIKHTSAGPGPWVSFQGPWCMLSHVPLTHSSDLAVHRRACWCAAFRARPRGPGVCPRPDKVRAQETPVKTTPHLLPIAAAGACQNIVSSVSWGCGPKEDALR